MFPPLLVERIAPPNILALFANLPRLGAILLDSAQCQHPYARYSFIACDPFQVITCKNHKVWVNNQVRLGNPFDILEEALAQYSLPLYPDLPPFQGGLAGCFSYELGKYLEKIPQSVKDALDFPELLVGFYDLVVAFDHWENNAFIMSSGFPEITTKKRVMRAEKRLNWMLEKVANLPSQPIPTIQKIKEADITSTFIQQEYEKAVRKVQNYIVAGDVFEANISQCFSVLFDEEVAHFDLYQILRQNNPAPFASFLQYGEYVIASASPERFLQLREGIVEACPIKGTAPRHQDPLEDKKVADRLLLSEKDRAENIMIVDLMRNDLSRVCLPHTVKVPKLCELQSFTTVHHLVSQVKGKLIPNKNAIDLLKVTFPGGSITGAPKIRAMEIIAEIEPTTRGPYCGSMGYIGFNGEMDLSILIRSFVCRRNLVTYQVGGAVTFDSDPAQEYAETLDKAKALRQTLLNL